jgi:hypothetical protein
MIEPQERDSDPALRGLRLDAGANEAKMTAPTLLAWVKERNDAPCLRVN